MLLEVQGSIGLVGVDRPISLACVRSKGVGVGGICRIGPHGRIAGGRGAGDVSLEGGAVGMGRRAREAGCAIDRRLAVVVEIGQGRGRGMRARYGRGVCRWGCRVGDGRRVDAEGLRREVAGLRVQCVHLGEQIRAEGLGDRGEL